MVFALNTVVGFACSVGVDMGFNSKHHHDDEATEAVVHIHKDGKRHIHHEKKEGHHHDKKEGYNHDKSHHHDQVSNHHQSGNEEGNCCNDKVLTFHQVDKAVPASVTLIHPVFLTAFAATYYSFYLFPHTNVIRDIKPFVRSYHPPIPDIRIAIQSFQI